MTARHSTNVTREVLLCELRCARMRAQLAMLEIESAGVALKHGLVSPEQCLKLLRDRGVADFLDLEIRSAA